MKPRLTVVGSANTDMIIKLDRIPRPGETILGGEFVTAPGGKGANQAVAAARAGGMVSFVARVGSDSLGDQALAGYTQDHIDTTYVSRDKKRPSGVALIFVAKDGENSIAVASGANLSLSPGDVKRAAKPIRSSQTVLTQLESPVETVAATAQLARRAGVRLILNPAPARKLPSDLLKLVSILTPNETEAEFLTGIPVKCTDSMHQAADKLLAMGVETVVMTLGARGAFLATNSAREFVPGFKVRAVDTTAAGDVFNGALAVALGEGKDLRNAVVFANAAAALSVTRFGAQPSAPRRREIQQFLNEPVNGTKHPGRR